MSPPDRSERADAGRPATAHFRRQHRNLTELAVGMLTGLDPKKCRVDGRSVRDALAVLTGRLQTHTAMEEQELYPRLRSHPDPEVRALAQRFWADFGEVYCDYFAFHEEWSALGAIEERPEAFLEALRGILMRLAERMNRENDELYATVDRLARDGR